MLVVETNGDNPIRRATAAEVEHRVVQFYDRCGYDTAYLSGANPVSPNLPMGVFQQPLGADIPLIGVSRRSIIVSEPRISATFPPTTSAGHLAHINPVLITQVAVPDVTHSDKERIDGEIQSSFDMMRLGKRACVGDGGANQTNNSISELGCQTNLGESRSVHHFACPFFQRSPSEHWKNCSRGWEHIHRLKFVSLIPPML